MLHSKLDTLRLTRYSRWLLPALILAIALLLRLVPLGRYVTPDEPIWVYRAIRFTDALAVHDWAAVPSTGHPGVTTMWLGAAGVAVRRLLDPAASAAHLDWIRHLAWLAPENGAAFRHLAFFLPAGRVAVALITALGLLALYELTARLFERRVALLTAGLLALDPFLIGHSGLLHTDALLTTFGALCVVCLLGTARGGKRAWAWSLGSGAAAGLALLTKSLGAFLIPWAIAVLGTAWLRGRMRLGQALGLAISWGLSCGALFVALYPAMWVAPWQTLQDLYGAPTYHATAALMPTFFAGRVALEHGPQFYAVALPLRLGPVVLLGLLLSLRTLVKKRSLRLELAWLWLFVGSYALLLALNVKKYDRYLLPAFPALALVAAVALSHFRVSRWGEGRAKLNLVLPLVLQLCCLLPFAAYPLTYYNPLLGGPPVAHRMLPTGWGEGMGATARWLNRRPDADRLIVATASVPTLAPLFNGHTVPLDQASRADYVVRPVAQSTPAAARSSTPVAHTAHLGFLDQAIVYTNTAPLEQAAYLLDRAEPDDLILLDAETSLLGQYTGPGRLVAVTDLPDQASVVARLTELVHGPRAHRIWLVADPAAAPITAAHLRQGLAAIATPIATATVASAHVVQFVPHDQQTTPPAGMPYRATFGQHITLVDAIVPVAAVNASCPVFLRWQTPAPTPGDLALSLQLLDSAGHLWAEVGQLVLDDVTFPTSAWALGEWADQVLTLELPARIPPGSYTVQATLADTAGAQLGTWDAGGQFLGVHVPLGEVKVAPPAGPIGPAPCLEGATFDAHPLVACVPDLRPQVIPSGDTLTLALTWSAAAVPEADYDVRWRLLDAAGAVALEQRGALAPYATSRWRADDSFEARYDLRLDPMLPATVYTLAFNVLTPGGHPLWPQDAELTTLEILARDRLFQLPDDVGHPLDLTLGSVVHLRGFDLDRTRATAGDSLSLTLYWQAEGPTDLHYTVFVHLVGPDGHSHGQVDRFPAGGAAPTASWAVGQVVVDEMELPVAADAPPGTYYIAVGMYDAASGGRLPLTDASGQSWPDDQAVLPVEINVTGD